jgi:hypothetical protein
MNAAAVVALEKNPPLLFESGENERVFFLSFLPSSPPSVLCRQAAVQTYDQPGAHFAGCFSASLVGFSLLPVTLPLSFSFVCSVHCSLFAETTPWISSGVCSLPLWFSSSLVPFSPSWSHVSCVRFVLFSCCSHSSVVFSGCVCVFFCFVFFCFLPVQP